MKNLAPNIKRQRLLIEGYYAIEVDKSIIEKYFNEITHHLNLKMYGDAIIYSPGKDNGKKENQGYDAFVPLIDSGISLYVWSYAKFISLIIYTCKDFDEKEAIEYTKKFWNLISNENQSF
jgi:S-adenosylmethionine decarboxylase